MSIVGYSNFGKDRGWLGFTVLPDMLGLEEASRGIIRPSYVGGFRIGLPGFKFRFHPLLVI